jgi:hypothetical protein
MPACTRSSTAPASQHVKNSQINNQAMNKSLLSFKQEATNKQAAY